MDEFDVLKVTSKHTGRSEFIRLSLTMDYEAAGQDSLTYLYQFCTVRNGIVQGYDYSDQLMDICPLVDLKTELESERIGSLSV